MTESQETIILANYLRANWYLFTKSPNETFTTSWNQKRKNLQEWVSKWFPDMCIILKRWSLLFIELKKAPWKKWGANGSTLDDPHQLHWIQELNKCDNVHAEMVQWANTAIELIKKLEEIT